MKIFWSWQSDTPGKIGRHLVREALEEAVESVKAGKDIDEPTTEENREKLHLDHDIKGAKGSPDLAATIFQKIDIAAVFIADVTLIASDENRKYINPNVAIELGYALKALTSDNVLLVFNEHYGSHEQLPFDLRHKGGAIVFRLSPASVADKALIKDTKARLRASFEQRLRDYLSVEPGLQPPISLTLETRPTYLPSTYFDDGESLASVGERDSDEVQLSYQTPTLSYLRLIPEQRQSAPLRRADLLDAVHRSPMLRNGWQGLDTLNKYGAIRFEPSGPNSSRLLGSTQLFQNGEIWCISAELIIQDRGNRPILYVPALPALAFESIYFNCLHQLAHFAQQTLFVSPPYVVEAGMCGVDGTTVYLDNITSWGQIQAPTVVHRGRVADPVTDSINSFLLKFFELIYDAVGYRRPEKLFGFPPDRPRP